MKRVFRCAAGISIAALGGLSIVAGGSASALTQVGTASAIGHGIFLPAPSHLVRSAGNVKAEESYNWSGYFQSGTKKVFTAVEATWKVPTVKTSKAGDQYSSDWVGIGGVTEGTLVQAGTEADNIGGTTQYDAWTEILPAAEVIIPGLTINPGDSIKTTVVEVATNQWKMTVKDVTTGQSGGKTVSYKSSGESAEAIHERPCIKDGCTSTSDLATLSVTNNVTFNPAEYSEAAAGATPAYKPLLKKASGETLASVAMVNNSGTKAIATPSKPSSSGEGFTVADGSVAPPPPA
jgi:hypothetical protein